MIFIFRNTSGSIDVNCTATLKDPENMSEQFSVGRMKDVDMFLELTLFYFWTPGIPWTLNELNFFCLNNNLCLSIYDIEGGTLLKSYGICGATNREFNLDFNLDFA